MHHRFLSTPSISFTKGNQPKEFDIYGASKYKKEFETGRQLGNRPARDSASWDLKAVSFDKETTFFKVGAYSTTLHIWYLEAPNNYTAPKDRQGYDTHCRKVKQDVQTFSQNFAHALSSYGFKSLVLGDVIKVVVNPRLRGEQKRAALCAELTKAMGSKNLKQTVLLIALNSKDSAAYSDIKWWGDCLEGVRTLCISPETLGKGVKNNLNCFGNLA